MRQNLGTTYRRLPAQPAPRRRSVSAHALPIFQGGLPAARIRQAQAQQGQALEQVVGTERAVVQAARAAFANYAAAQNAIQANTVAVQANELALEGNRAEQSVGTRTIIEVLNAEQELLQLAGRAGDCQARRLCRWLPASERHGPGRGAGSRARRRAALRSARQLSPRREQLERLGERSAASDGRNPDRQLRKRCRPIQS